MTIEQLHYTVGMLEGRIEKLEERLSGITDIANKLLKASAEQSQSLMRMMLLVDSLPKPSSQVRQ